MESTNWVLWGAELSPFALKLEAMLRFAGRRFQWQPRAGGPLRAARFALRRRRLVTGRLPLTYPPPDPLDEFPLVPFLFGPTAENLFDTSAIASWLDEHPDPSASAAPLLPRDDLALRLAVRLVDEALDEVGLYLVHHNRWVVSARDNGAGERLAEEMRPLYGPLSPLLRRFFPARQCRRLPYLFSVAPPGDHSWDDLPPSLRPPSKEGFPPTHDLLDEAYRDLLAAVEPVLARRPFLFGGRFTLADASLYGQLAMNRHDGSARALLSRLAPATEAWLDRIACGRFEGHDARARLGLDEGIGPLLGWVAETFIPLMRQNRDAYERHRAAGETLFNEAAFDRGRSLYDGALGGRPYRSVAKSFQVRVWRDLEREWQDLPSGDRRRVEAVVPREHGLDMDRR